MKNIDSYLNGDGARAVIFGGAGAEHDISRLSACGFIAEAEQLNFDILPIFVDKNGDFYIYVGDTSEIGDISRAINRDALLPTFPTRLSGKCGFAFGGGIIQVSLAVPVLHGDFGEDGRVQGLLECAGIRLAGADTVSGAVMSDKAYSKAVAAAAGVKTLPWLVCTIGEFSADASALVGRVVLEIGLPAFIKPTGLGSSIGAAAAYSESEIYVALERAFSVSERVMAEPLLQGKRELECAFFDMHGKRVISHPAEVITQGGFYDYGRKYLNTDEVRLSVHADVPGSVASLVRKTSGVLAAALGARHIARFDYFLAGNGELYFNEVNSFPGLTSGSLYTRMLAECGIGYSDFVRFMLTV